MRRRQAEKKPVMPDPKFNDELVGYFINCVMKSGKKSIAEKLVYSSFESLLEKAKHQKDIHLDESGDSGSESGGDTGTASITSIPAHLADDLAQMLRVFKKALNNICPLVELKSRRVGGATYQIPIEVPPRRRVTLGIRWLVAAARKRSEKGMNLRLAGELLDALLNRGEAVKKREDTYRMAKANQAFAHYRW